MNSILDTYFAILRDYFWSTDQNTEEPIDWDAIIQIASRQGTLPLLADYALKQSGEGCLTQELKLQLKQYAVQNMLHQQRLKSYLRMVKDCLDAAAIPFVLLKGYGLAALYPNPEVRSSSDVDIWVGRENFQRAITVLKQLPDVVTYEEQEADNVRHFNLHWCNRQYVVEVHPVSYSFVSPREKSRYDELEQAGLHHTPYTVHQASDRTPYTIHSVSDTPYINIDTLPYRVPTMEFNALYVFLHMWHHYLTEGVQIRQLIDWMLVLHQLYTIHSAQRDTLPNIHHTSPIIHHPSPIIHHPSSTIENDLCLFHLTEPWRVFGYIAVHYLGLPIDEMPLYDESASTIRQSQVILSEMIYGKSRPYHHREYGRHGVMHKLEVLRDVWTDYRDVRKMFPDYAWHRLSVMLRRGLMLD